jgi:ubiquitin C-terminal hydrolase
MERYFVNHNFWNFNSFLIYFFYSEWWIYISHLFIFLGFEQHDAQEYLIFLLYCLHEDLNKITTKHTKVEVDEKLEASIQAKLEWEEESKISNSFLSDLMMGISYFL